MTGAAQFHDDIVALALLFYDSIVTFNDPAQSVTNGAFASTYGSKSVSSVVGEAAIRDFTA